MTSPSPIIRNFKLVEKNSLRGFFDVELPSGMILSGCQLCQNEKSTWVGLPAKPWTKDDGTTSWTKIVDFRDTEARARFQDVVKPLAIAAFELAKGAA